jgi:PadR family transcriptional regulator, regulatory protein PadR
MCQISRLLPWVRAGLYKRNIVTLMPAKTTVPVLGEFELLAMLAVMQLGDEAYPLAVADRIEQRTGRKASRPAVFITLERLEDKGLLTSRYGDPTPVRGGRSKRLFSPKPLALQAVQAALDRINAMTAGVTIVEKLR